MNGLRNIVKQNNAAVAAHITKNGGRHLLSAPTRSNFNFNIPWDFKDNVLHAYIHTDTKGSDLIKLKRLVAGQEGVGFAVEIHEYQ